MSEIGTVYGLALYDLCQAEGLSQQVLSELTALETGFRENPDFLRLLSSPSLTKGERCGILDSSFRGQVHSYVLDFLKLLTERSYLAHLRSCCRVYRGCYEKDHNILPVTVTTALPLTQLQEKRLSKRLSALTGKTVQLLSRIDSEVVGGVRLDYDGKRLDDTIAARMHSIRSMLQNTAL